MDNNIQNVQMTASELAQFEAYKSEQAKKEKSVRLAKEREAYKELVDETVNGLFPSLQAVSKTLAEQKKGVYETFQKALIMKEELFEVKADQRSHTFTNKEQTKRITLGQYETDCWDDTFAEGEAMVKEHLASLAKDKESQALINAIIKLLSKDKAGNFKLSRVVQLQQLAEDIGAEKMIEGVKIIIAAHRPAVSKYYVKAEYKNDMGAWVSTPLGMTEA